MIQKNRIRYFVFIAILIIGGLNFLILNSTSTQRMADSTTTIQINDNERKPVVSGSCQDWVRTWGQIDEDEILEGMDVYNKTGDVYLIGWDQTFIDDDIKLVKYNKSGVLEWSITLDYDEDPTGQDIGEDVVVDQITGEIYILASVFNNTNEDLFIAKYSSDGQQLWNTTWGYNTWEYGAGISYDNIGYLYVTGTIRSATNDKIVLVKIDENTGAQEWNATWDEPLDDIAYDVACGPSGDIYITGSTENPADDKDMALIKYDENNIQIWNTTWDLLTNTYNETGHAVGVDSQGDIYVTGVYEFDPTYDSWMFLNKYNTSGYLNWSRTYGGSFNVVEGNDLYIDAEDNIFVAIAGYGTLYGNSLIIQEYNSTGSKILEINWAGVSNFLWTEAISGYNSSIYVAGIIETGPSWENDFIVVKNPSNVCPSGGVPSDGDDDDDDDDKETVIPGYDYFLIIGIMCLISTLIIIDFKKKR